MIPRGKSCRSPPRSPSTTSSRPCSFGGGSVGWTATASTKRRRDRLRAADIPTATRPRRRPRGGTDTHDHAVLGPMIGSVSHGDAVARFLAQFSTTSRAEALHWALQALRARVEPDRVLACELAWEVHQRGYWSQVRRSNGGPYESEET